MFGALPRAAVAQTWLKSGKTEEAEKFLADCLKDTPKDVNARLLLAQVAIVRKDWEKARDVYREVLKDEKDNLIAQINLAWVLAEHLDQSAEALTIMRGKLRGTI